MAVPKKRKSKARTRAGRSHHALKQVVLKLTAARKCPACGEYVLAHRECKCQRNK